MYRKIKPPIIAEFFLRLFLNKESSTHRLGDFEEIYLHIAEKSGRFAAWQYYWFQVVRSAPMLIFNSIYLGGAMFNNYLKITLRNLKKHKGYSFINIAGLAIGIACTILIFLYIQNELSYDKYHKNSSDIYRIVNPTFLNNMGSAVTPAPLAPLLKKELPEIISNVRIRHYRNDVLLSHGKDSFLESGVYWADPDLFEIFDLPLVNGNMETALTDPYSIIISEKMGKKYFRDEDPLGKTIQFEGVGYQSHDFIVTGVLKTMQENSHFIMDFIAPFATNLELQGRDITSWNFTGYHAYLLLEKGTDPHLLKKKIDKVMVKHGRTNEDYHLQPLTDIHLHSHFGGEISPNSDIKYIYLFSSIAFLILLIACINYMNLATARSTQRAKEVGLRKIVGAQRPQLIKQFFGESVFITCVAIILALVIVQLSLPAFNFLIQRNLQFNLLNNQILWVSLFAIMIFISVFAGSYPALFISSFKPISILRNKIYTGSKGSLLRNSLIIFQFTISIILIASTFITQDQLSFIRNKDVSSNWDQIVVLRVRDKNARENLSAIKNELVRHPNVISASSSQHLPNRTNSWTGASRPGKPADKYMSICENIVDYDFLNIYNIEIVQGRNFSRDFSSDANGAYLINEVAQKTLGWESPIGKEFSAGGNKQGKIVGVMKDFHLHSLHSNIEPLYFLLDTENNKTYLSVKIIAKNIPKTLNYLKEQMSVFSPKYPFEYSFYDEIFNKAYKSEQKLNDIFSVFSLIAIVIACLGLFGLSFHTVERRTKEIGIRKVVGANIYKIILLLSKEFAFCFVIANIFAWPIAYFSMNKWLENFAYRIDISIGTLIFSAIMLMIIAMLTISYQTVKAAMKNPVDSLKYE